MATNFMRMMRFSRSTFVVPVLVAGLAGGCVARPSASTSTEPIDLVVAATTDVHGRLRGWEYYANAPDSVRGLSRAATVVDSLRAAHPGSVVLVDAGDLLQGNPLTYVAARVSSDTVSPVVAAMNVMRYDAAAVGNHEFNYGLPLFRRVEAQANFPFLATNAYTPSGERAFPGWRIVERQGVKIGIIGATTPGSMIWDRDNLRGRLVIRDIVPEVRSAVAAVRRAGAAVIIVSVHSGLGPASSYDTLSTGVPSENVTARIAREVEGIDLIVLGHSHGQVADTTIGTTLLMQPRNWAASVAVAHMHLERDGRRWRVASKRGSIIPVRGRREDPAVLAATEKLHRETVEYVTRPIGSTPVAWRADSARVRDAAITDFMLDVMRSTAKSDLAATAAFSLEASLPAGPITIAQLARLYPYDNTLRAVRISGKQLRDFLEYSARYYRTVGDSGSIVDPSVPGYNFDIVSGADYTIDLTKPVGSRITRLIVKGEPVAPTDSFTMALNNYRQTGGGGYTMLVGAPVVYDEDVEIRQLLIDEVQRRGTIHPADYFNRNWEIVPASAVSEAYRAMNRDLPVSATGRADGAALEGAVRLRVISTNDFHGALESRPDARGRQLGGAGTVAAAIDRARAECAPPRCYALLLDGGDMWQGTPVSNLAFGKPVVEIYNTLGYAGAALGNHEFDWGTDSLRARMREARFRIMGANVRYADGRDVEWVPNDTIVRRGPLDIGLIGVALESTPRSTLAANVAGLRFDPAAPIVDSIGRALRARGAEAIVVVAHVGAFCKRTQPPTCEGEIIELAQALQEPVDAIVSGHTHSPVNVVVSGIPIVQARSRGQSLAVMDIAVDTAAGIAGKRSRSLGRDGLAGEIREMLTDSLPRAPGVDSMARAALRTVASRVDSPVARFSERMGRGRPPAPLGNFIADAQRWAGKADVAVMNNGGIRADIQAGPATYGTLFEVQPFANTLYKVTLTGRQLRRYFEQVVGRDSPDGHISGIRIAYDSTAPAGSRIVSATFTDGRSIDSTAKYTLVMNNFMATGGDELGLEGFGVTPTPLSIVDLDALIDYARSRPQPIVPPAEPRLVVVSPGAQPAPAGTP